MIATSPIRNAPRPGRPWQLARLTLGATTALGLARFAYGLLVPAMRTDLGWNLAQVGAMTTANGIGYLVGALLTAPLARLLTSTGTFRWGMVGCVGALGITAVSSSYPALLAARLAAGAAGSLVLVTGSGIASRLATAVGSATPIGVYVAGSGAGIVLGGDTVPSLLDRHPERWPTGLARPGAGCGSWR
ncbi:YbfB/YjiJ family MFS transporter [Dactylosporangium sucinum]|uniref:YbfB/YjiJ family MFS transporter n=1 Tax=Dactylosporangium sucinum TaxID=1424081 RepID=UPI00227BAC92|nr:YbfB/YjiJ family MFS transporter [Dactylosporangium sucinum]